LQPKGLIDLMRLMPLENLGALLSMVAPRKETDPKLFSKGYRETTKKPDMYKRSYKGYYR